MKEKVNQKAFIQIPLLIAIIVSIVATAGVGYGAFEYYKTSKIVKEAKQLTEEEKYDEAISKLGLAQASLIVEILNINKQEINNEINENKERLEDKQKYDQASTEFNNGNWQTTINLLSQLSGNSFYYQKAQTKIEESKRKMVEGELSEEQVARQKAESKVKQEEFEKRLKEQELTSKEEQEKMMNADNDGDGLTYRREQELGTSDFNKDSDSDGIPDNLDLHPAGGGRYQAQTFTWSYGGYDWTWTINIHEDWYEYYKGKPRVSQGITYITSNDPFIKKISEKISEGATGNIEETWLAVSFVQNLSYVDDVYTGYDEYPKYPVETFFEKNGDCEDTSYLAASIIDAMDIGSVLILLPGHMAVGVWMECNTPGTYYEFDGRCYYYVETTSKDWAGGEIPDRYRNTRATLIKIPSGETIDNISPQYVKPCYSSPDFPRYYSDGKNFYSDSQCNNPTYCLPYKEFYVKPLGLDLYWDSGCDQIVVIGCRKSNTYPGYFYKSGSAWYYDSACTQTYQSMTCNSPYSYNYLYSCTSEYSYSSKQSTCDYYASSKYLKDMAQSCYDELAKCREDINLYQSRLTEYNQCVSRKEY